MKTAATTRIPAPASLAGKALPGDLVADFAAPGYDAKIDGDEIVVTRSGETHLPTDVDALPALIDAPFGEEETASLRGLVAMWEAQ